MSTVKPGTRRGKLRLRKHLSRKRKKPKPQTPSEFEAEAARYANRQGLAMGLAEGNLPKDE